MIKSRVGELTYPFIYTFPALFNSEQLHPPGQGRLQFDQE